VASSGGLEAIADVDPYGVQRQAWRRPFLVRLTAPEWSQQCLAWRCEHGAAARANSGGDGVPSAYRHDLALQVHENAFRGCSRPPLRGRGALAVQQ
jgi:hypothetical protein